MSVRLGNLYIERRARETRDNKHGHGVSLATFDCILNDADLHSKHGESFLTAQARVGQQFCRPGGVGEERLVRRGSGEDNGRDNVLRVSGRTMDERAEGPRREVADLDGNAISSELGRMRSG